MMVQYTESSFNGDQESENSQMGLTCQVDDVSPIAEVKESEYFDHTQSHLEEEKSTDQAVSKSRNSKMPGNFMQTFLEAFNGPSTDSKVTNASQRQFETFNQHNKQPTEDSSTGEKNEDW